MNTHIPHISFSELADIAEDHSSASAEIVQHLAACSHCSQELRAIRQTLALMKSDHTEAAPVELVNYAKNLFRGQRVAPKPSLVERVLAVLAFDSLTVAPGFGLRSGLAGGRQLIYATEMADIDLRVSPQSGEWEIAGQILGSSHSEGKVNLESDAFSASVNLNELSEFSFQSVPRGTYRMFVHLPNVEIETPPLEVGQ